MKIFMAGPIWARNPRTKGCRSFLKGLVERGLRGVRLVTSDDHEAIKQAVQVELPQAAWQRCIVHFQRNLLWHVPQAQRKAVADDLKVIFQAARRETAEQLAASFRERYADLYPKAVALLSRGLAEERQAYLYKEAPIRNRRLTAELQELYDGRCQITGWAPRDRYGHNLCQAHHIHWLSRGGEDTLENLMLVSPNLHAAIHRCDAPFDYEQGALIFDGHTEPLRFNRHLPLCTPA